MANPYYTDEMRLFVYQLDNKYNFPVEISLLGDDLGEYLVLTFDMEDYEALRQKDHFREVCEYLIRLRDGLIKLGARVTFAVRGDTNEKERTDSISE